MVDKLSRYEIKILNRIIYQTNENADFDVFKIVNESNYKHSGFDKKYVRSPDHVASKIANFLIDKRLAEKVYLDKTGFQNLLQWTDKGVRLKKYGNYRVYTFMAEKLPEIYRLTIWLSAIIATLWGLIQIFKSCKS